MPDTSSSHLGEAQRLLRQARHARAEGGEQVLVCVRAADQAYEAAFASYMAGESDFDAAETMYHARACLGRLYRYRGEHHEGLRHYRRALGVVEEVAQQVPRMRRWLAPAYHDCYAEARLAGDAPPEMKHWAEGLQAHHGELGRFVHDLAYLQLAVQSRDPHDLWATARCALHITDGLFERMVLWANMALAAGHMGNVHWFARSRQHFEQVADALGSREGLAMHLLDIAAGAQALGMAESARETLELAACVAEGRGELVLKNRALALLHTMGRTAVAGAVPLAS